MHEIGHTLGLMHNTKNLDAIMCGYITSNHVSLSSDDIHAIQSLYGRPKPRSFLPNSRITTTTTTIQPNFTTTIKPMLTNTTAIPNIVVSTTNRTILNEADKKNYDLCRINQPSQMVITSSAHHYIFHKGQVWILHLRRHDDKSVREINGENYGRQVKPLKIQDYLPGLNFTHIIQLQSDELLVLNNNTKSFSIIEFPSLIIKKGWENRNLNAFGLSRFVNINAIFNSYTGRIFIFYDNLYFIEINECDFAKKSYGLISERFSGLPGSDIINAFRYDNGNLYFFY